MWQVHEMYFLRYAEANIKQVDTLDDDFNLIVQAFVFACVMRYIQAHYAVNKIDAVGIFGAGYRGFCRNKKAIRKKVSKIILSNNQAVTTRCKENT
jgi:uncharacterized alpha/beta hydrolase family protein